MLLSQILREFIIPPKKDWSKVGLKCHNKNTLAMIELSIIWMQYFEYSLNLKFDTNISQTLRPIQKTQQCATI